MSEERRGSVPIFGVDENGGLFKRTRQSQSGDLKSKTAQYIWLALRRFSRRRHESSLPDVRTRGGMQVGGQTRSDRALPD